MSVVETPTVDCVHQRSGSGTITDHHRLPSKRKLDDYGPNFDEDDDNVNFMDLVSARMRKDEPNAVNSSSDTHSHAINGALSHVDTRVSYARSNFYSCSTLSDSNGLSSMLQFFIRMTSQKNTMVIHASSDDTVKSLHERIQATTGIPVFEQRLIYRGKQLQLEKSLAECSIQNDANLQLVGRMRSTKHPKAWQVINDMVALICRLCRGETEKESLKTIKGLITNYMNQASKIKTESVSDYFQIFMSSSAPAVLVMLYMSPFEGNKDCADYSIRHFLNSSRTISSKPLLDQCALIVLEFCKMLRRVAFEDSLYHTCRSTLGSLLENVGTSHGSENAKVLILMQEIFPFVRELANRLLAGLDSSMKSPSDAGLLSNDVRDFSLFLLPFISSDGNSHKQLLCWKEIEILRVIFRELLQKMDDCLREMEVLVVKEGDVIYSAWSQYLSVLKELSNMSKLYHGAEIELWTVLRLRRRSLCLLILKYAKQSDNHQWILGHNDVTDFESRRHLAMMMFPEVKEDYEELHEMLIDRSQLLAESFEYIAHAEPESLLGGLFMEFKNEEATGPGVLREWFFLVCQAIFNPENALFVACPNDRRRFFPNPASKVDPMHLEYFSFCGRVIALALMHKVQVGVVLDRVFFSQLAGKNISLEDIREADPWLYSSCKQILEMDAEDIDSDALGLTFVREVEELGCRRTVELCTGGKTLVVNSKNREVYVDLLIQHHFVTSISEQVSRFAQGFADILCNSRLQEFFQSLELEDLDGMLHGSENSICVEDWKAHTDYNGYKETDPQILWFWEIVGGMSAEQRKILLFFWTSVKYLPVEGFGGLASRLFIYRSLEPHDHLPSSHTCFYRLCFPPYPSMAVMQDRLRIITQEHVGCSFGTW
ncbi:E3 ubiquitin-protein ligase UPL5 [Quillaja saponaria]|uniref:HECT-type E3 ubiquitin transferase n=1 Tax=Quillaja saponaria TaxID=32244 RepID=A0AAD7P965_QUISA|nr:E3 ubiquitin-protein ligase UPL5 [Quillaja saponaria]